MLEDSLMESQNRLSSPNQRWTTILSLTVQCSVVAAILTLPLLHPDTLPFRLDAPKIMLPLKPVPPPIPHVETGRAAFLSTASDAARPYSVPTDIPPLGRATSDEPPTGALLSTGMGDPNGIASTLANTASGTGPHVTLAPTKPLPKGPLQISTGVSTGLLLAPIQPIYPRIAIVAHVEGAVKIEAVISKSGHIESARVTSGPEMLRQSALEAIRNARYTPYLLNGSPTEVETTITVNFKLSS